LFSLLLVFPGRSLGFRHPLLEVSYTLRVYPRGFTAEDFGKAPSSPDNDWEAVHGFTFGVRF